MVQSLQDVLRAETSRLMAIPGVVGIAEGARADGTPCILVLVESDSAELRARVPKSLGGHAVEIRPTGTFEARPEDGG